MQFNVNVVNRSNKLFCHIFLRGNWGGALATVARTCYGPTWVGLSVFRDSAKSAIAESVVIRGIREVPWNLAESGSRPSSTFCFCFNPRLLMLLH